MYKAKILKQKKMVNLQRTQKNNAKQCLKLNKQTQKKSKKLRTSDININKIRKIFKIFKKIGQIKSWKIELATTPN